MDQLFNIFWLFLMIASITPWLQKQMLESSRFRLLRSIEHKRGSRVIAMIHRQESMNLLGLPIGRYIDIEDSEQVLRAIKLTDPDMPIDFILHTPGGLVLAAEQIARALAKHRGKVTVFVPHYAMSGGTLLALAADEIVMDDNAVLGPVDPQIGNYAAASIVNVLEEKDHNRIDDETLMLADVSRKALRQVRETILEIAGQSYSPEVCEHIADELASGKYTHDYPVTVDEARQLGLRVSTEMPKEVYELMALYHQAGTRRPAVDYVPSPYTAPSHPPVRRGNPRE